MDKSESRRKISKNISNLETKSNIKEEKKSGHNKTKVESKLKSKIKSKNKSKSKTVDKKSK